MGLRKRIVMRAGTRNSLWLFIVLCIGTVGCGEIELQSVWLNRDIVIDGDGSDWNGAFSHIDWANTAVGLCNDGDALYIGMVPRGRDVQAHIASVGCELWFDTPADDYERFGLRFPFGDASKAMGMVRDASRTEAVNAIQHLSERVNTVEMLDENGTVIAQSSMSEAERAGLEIAVGEYQGRLLVEARIPFAFELGGKQVSVHNDPATPLELVIQTPEGHDRDREREPFMPPDEVSGAVEFEEYERHTDDEYLEAVIFRQQVQINMKISLAAPPSGGAGATRN